MNLQPLDEAELRDKIEDAAMHGFIEDAYDVHGIPEQSIDKLFELFQTQLAAARINSYLEGVEFGVNESVELYAETIKQIGKQDLGSTIVQRVKLALQSQADTNQSHEGGDLDG